MKRWPFLLLALLVSCSETPSNSPASTMSRTPLSVRGWIHDIEGAKTEQIPDVEIARRAAIFAATTVYVDKSEFSSGGVSENGAFVVLDVPHDKATVVFQSAGITAATLTLQNVPGTADVLVPSVILRQGEVKILDPKAIKVRVVSEDGQPRATGQFAIVAGHRVPVMEVPLQELATRREYPQPPGFRPVATVR
ncbi:MAG TPA: hypothetical protein VF618_15065 [Thermoanaerobaculia bacterium]